MIYVMGMSHTLAILQAAAATQFSLSAEAWAELTQAGQFREVETKPGLLPGDKIKALIVFPGNGHAELRIDPDGTRQVLATEAYLRVLQAMNNEQNNNILFSFIGGNEHTVLSIVQHPVPYDFHLPSLADDRLVPGAQPVPYEVIRHQLEKSLNHTIAMVLMTRSRLPHMRLVHVLPPPPVGSEQQILAAPEIFGEKFRNLGITPLSIRVKYYLLYADILRDALQPFNIEILAAPPEAVAENGALKDYYSYQTTHANQKYGELVCRQMREFIERG